MNLFEFIANNLGHVIPILSAGAIALAIMIERMKALYVHYPMKNAQSFFREIESLVGSGKLVEATQLCDQYPQKPVAQVTKAALIRSHLPDDAIEQGVAMKMSESTRAIQKRTAFLATIANVATLLGLIGTIAGLIHSFEAVGHADAQQKSALLSAGIATAMNATMLGLGVAIPCMVVFSLFVSRANKIIGDMEDAAMKIVDILKLRYYRAEELQPETSRSA
jgi:biopolymer transport protein ExbB/TolQ